MGPMPKKDFQEDLNKMYRWADENNMEYNDPKFELITFGKPSRRNYKTPKGTAIKRKTVVKDLGVYMSSDGKFEEHIWNVIKQTQKISSWVLRTFRTRNKLVMRTLLKSIIIPKIEYASVLWSPTNVTLIHK